MKKEIADLLADTLENGEYEQGTAALCTISYAPGLKGGERKDRFCCLGVLCELAIKAGIGVTKREDTIEGRAYYEGIDRVLPSIVAEWAGMHSSTGTVKDGVVGLALTTQNDGGSSFKQIAEYIRERWEDL